MAIALNMTQLGGTGELKARVYLGPVLDDDHDGDHQDEKAPDLPDDENDDQPDDQQNVMYRDVMYLSARADRADPRRADRSTERTNSSSAQTALLFNAQNATIPEQNARARA